MEPLLQVRGVSKSFPGVRALDGVDLIPFVTGRDTGRPHQTLHWKSGNSWAVRDGDLELVVGDGRQPGAPELYDLATDISESTNLAAGHADDLARLQRLHEEWTATHKPTPWRGREAANDQDPGDEPAPRKSRNR